MAEKTKRLTKSDLLFLIAMTEKGLVFMDYYNESGRVKARQRLDRIKRETAGQED